MNLYSMRGAGVRIGGGNPWQTGAIWAGAVAMLCAMLPVWTIGCGMAASPQPPSLKLPKPIINLTAERAGNQVSLHWTTPSETTDRLKIKGPVELRICRKLGTAPCAIVSIVSVAPGKPADAADTLTAALAAGPLHAITYEIFAVNKHARSAGPSNSAAALAGEAPPVVQNFSATMVEQGVVLHWQPMASLQPDTTIQLQRTLLNPNQPRSKTPTGLPAASEPVEQMLRIPFATEKTRPGTALDASVVFNRKYRYVAVRITAIKIEKERLELTSAPSQPVIIFTRDTFPPAAPTGLAAVPVSASMNDGTPEVDLSWSANTEPDLAQYLIYRRDIAAGTAATQIAPENSSTLIIAPAFRDQHVQPGHSYAYSVVAVDNSGNGSPRSTEVTVTVPGA